MSFDKIARHYDWLEAVLAAGRLQRCRTAFLEQAREAKSILLVGEGHGRFLSELLRVNPSATITCVEASTGMVEVAKGRLRREGFDPNSIGFHAIPVQQFESDERFDVAATHFFLDCFEGAELDGVIRKVANLLVPGGAWIVSDFQVPKRGWRRARALVVLRLAYGFFRFATRLPSRRLAAPAPFLERHGFHSEVKVSFNFGLLYSELWRRLEPESLKAVAIG